MITKVFYVLLALSFISTTHAQAETVALSPFMMAGRPTSIKKDSQTSIDIHQEKDSELNYTTSPSKEEERYAEIHDTESSLKYFFETNHESCAGRICFGLIPIPIPIPGAYFQSRDTRLHILLLTTGTEKLLMFRYRF
jgi:hypothetical protein